jgi:hypothetical protein
VIYYYYHYNITTISPPYYALDSSNDVYICVHSRVVFLHPEHCIYAYLCGRGAEKNSGSREIERK